MQEAQTPRQGGGATLWLELQPSLDERGVTLEQVSEGTGLSMRKLQQVLDSDIDKVRLPTIGALCVYFGVDARAILKPG